MALHFSCNQYEQEFNSNRLQNWEVAKTHRERPNSLDGFTQIIATDRGHLMDGVPRSKQSPWGSFVGNWDMPLHIPGNKQVNPTARSSYAHQTLLTEKIEKDYVIKGKQKSHAKTPSPINRIREGLAHEPMRSGAENPLPLTSRKSVSPVVRTATPVAMQGDGTCTVAGQRTPPPATPPAVPDPTSSPLPVRARSMTPVNSPTQANAHYVAAVTPMQVV